MYLSMLNTLFTAELHPWPQSVPECFAYRYIRCTLCMPVCKQGAEKGVRFSRPGAMDSCKLPQACSDWNPGSAANHCAISSVLSPCPVRLHF